uniref:BPTI/Kunitz inhibitor domain-containing protein n=1 Tax=Elaeophora elaphi TaxID=1147741 RepID=A0A0R3RGC4_9BILA
LAGSAYYHCRGHLSCAIYHVYPLADPYCHLKRNYESERSILQYYSCECVVEKKTDQQLEKCDAEINPKLLLASANWSRPNCFFTSITRHRPIFISGKQLSLQEGFEEETENVPVCAAAIIINNFGVFYRFYTSHYSQFHDEVESKKRFFVTKQRNSTIYTTLCHSNQTTPCNNIQNLMSHYLSYSIISHSKRKKPQAYHRCIISGDAKTRTEPCSSTRGCFSFSYLHSQEKLVNDRERERERETTGCVEKIPALVKTSPDLSPLLWCFEKVYHESKYRCRAYKGINNVTASGTLCCCYKDCFIMFVTFTTTFSR